MTPEPPLTNSDKMDFSETRNDPHVQTYSYNSPYWNGGYKSERHAEHGSHGYRLQGGLKGPIYHSGYDRGNIDYYDDYAKSSGYGGYDECWGSSGSGGGLLGGSGAIDDSAIAIGILGAGALVFYILYQAITVNIMGRKRRRDIDPPLAEWLPWSGLEEFEEKIDRIAENQGEGEGANWISQIYKQFAGQYADEVDNELKEADLDGLEPPILDETWELGLRTPLNSTVSSSNSTRTRRETDDDVNDTEAENRADEDLESAEDEECRLEMWRCLSKVIEGGLHHMDKPEGLMGFAKKTMFKIAFHGGLSNVWSGVMSIPEARNVKKCMNTHQECIAYSVLRKEARASLDPSDPEYEHYAHLRKDTVTVNSTEEEDTKPVKRQRLIVNPEFVENVDTSDGSEQYDDNVQK